MEASDWSPASCAPPPGGRHAEWAWLRCPSFAPFAAMRRLQTKGRLRGRPPSWAESAGCAEAARSRRIRDAILSPIPEGDNGAARPSVLSEEARPSHLSAQRSEVPVRPSLEAAPGLGCVRPRLLTAVVWAETIVFTKPNLNLIPFPTETFN